MSRREHWEAVYRDKADTELSWFQPHPGISLSLIEALRPAPRRVIDIGGGQSALASGLLARGIEDVTVLDIAETAIDRGRQRLGDRAQNIRWVVADVLAADDLGRFDLWHDRAVFHFLTDPRDRARYIASAAGAVVPGGHVIIGTFAPTGPERCSGLEVCRYDAAALASEFAGPFRMADSAAETHRTPWGAAQDFTYVTLERLDP